LNVFPFALVWPIRERKGDILPIAHHLLAKTLLENAYFLVALLKPSAPK